VLVKVQLATRVDQALRRRLRVHAAITGRTVEDLVSEALDGYLPPAEDMVRAVGSGPREETLLAEQPGVA
jgi:plasmid stability protein